MTHIQKIIKVGPSAAVTIPAKEMKRQNMKPGDEVEVIIRPASKAKSTSDEEVIKAAKDILNEYRQDFKNLADR